VIEVLDLATGTRRAVARTPDGTSAYYDPRWSPDGRFITATFETYTDADQGTPTSSSIVVIDALGTPTGVDHTVITPSDVLAAQPAWGPDDTIVFLTTSALGAWPEDASLMLIDADGTGLRRLVDISPGVGVPVDPSWTSDGRIMFTVANASESHAATVALDGTGLELATWSLPVPTGSVQRTYARPRPAPAPAPVRCRRLRAEARASRAAEGVLGSRTTAGIALLAALVGEATPCPGCLLDAIGPDCTPRHRRRCALDPPSSDHQVIVTTGESP
jgi:Tol biopolymer transport system component